MTKNMFFKILFLVSLIIISVFIGNCYTTLSHPEIELPDDYKYDYDYYQSYGYGRCYDCHHNQSYYSYRYSRYYSPHWRYYYTYPRWWYDYYWNDNGYDYWDWHHNNDDDDYQGPPVREGGRNIGNDQKSLPSPVIHSGTSPVHNQNNSSGNQSSQDQEEQPKAESKKATPKPPAYSKLKNPTDDETKSKTPAQQDPVSKKKTDDNNNNGNGNNGNSNSHGTGSDKKGF